MMSINKSSDLIYVIKQKTNSKLIHQQKLVSSDH